MKYTKKSLVGDMGEHFFVYKIMEMFNWPCRLYGIDLGIDAEIEILDNENRTTGRIIKVQIKSTTEKEESNTPVIYVDDRHVTYWKNLTLPLIVCCVDLYNKKIYWKQIEKSESYDSKGVSKKIIYNDKDILDITSKDDLISLIDSKSLDIFQKYLSTIKSMVDFISEKMLCYNDGNNFDIDDVKAVYSEFNHLKDLIHSTNTIIETIPSGSMKEQIDEYRLLIKNYETLDSEFSHIEELVRTDYGDEFFERVYFTYRDIDRMKKDIE